MVKSRLAIVSLTATENGGFNLFRSVVLSELISVFFLSDKSVSCVSEMKNDMIGDCGSSSCTEVPLS